MVNDIIESKWLWNVGYQSTGSMSLEMEEDQQHDSWPCLPSDVSANAADTWTLSRNCS